MHTEPRTAEIEESIQPTEESPVFGLSWGQVVIIVLVGMFVLGPERIPTAIGWALGGVRRARAMASGAQADLHREFGAEIAELRRQVAELRSLKELQELRDLRELHPQRFIGESIPGDGSSGGVNGFLAPTEAGPPAPDLGVNRLSRSRSGQRSTIPTRS